MFGILFLDYGLIRGGTGPVAAPACVISGGETTVSVRGQGSGGRCQEFALAAALAMEGMKDVVLLAAGTDGPTAAAGAIADGTSASRARAHGVGPAARLADNDSNPVFARLSATSWSPGRPTPISSTSTCCCLGAGRGSEGEPARRRALSGAGAGVGARPRGATDGIVYGIDCVTIPTGYNVLKRWSFSHRHRFCLWAYREIKEN